MSAPLDHLVVLALENRSFDHMLGYLDHPDPRFDGLLGREFANPGWRGQPASVLATTSAKAVLPVDPDHSHDAVMQQLAIHGRGSRRSAQMRGFVESYERKGRGLAPPRFAGLLGPFMRWRTQRQDAANAVEGRGPLAMACQDPSRVRALATLALEFAVCSRWFASVPGETWPNRNFMHAATSHGTTDIELDFYTDRTIFELLEDHQRDWHIYFDDTPQVWAFRRLWDDNRKACWHPFHRFAEHVAADSLPAYSFIEPNHRPPLHLVGGNPLAAGAGPSNSQHPGNNQIPNGDYDAYATSGHEDFVRGDQLIANVYETLRANPAVFARTLLLVTYDEHGGLCDHVPPPSNVPAPGGSTSPSLFSRLRDLILRRKTESFDFTTLGVRVPAVVVSPLVPVGVVDNTPRDHASIPATARRLFAPEAPPLTNRDAWAPPFSTLASLDEPRVDLPDLSAYTASLPADSTSPPPAVAAYPDPAHYQPFSELARRVATQLPTPNPSEALNPVEVGRYATQRFTFYATGVEP